MFIDTAKISIRGGDGGNGAVSFHREKYVAAGGPDGGDGGDGGNVVLRVDDHMATLMDFRYQRKYAAPNGENGQGKRCSGRHGEDLVIRVPRGTVVRDAESGAVMHDMSDGADYVAARGGRGGWGNRHFATPTRQTPRFAKNGLKGEAREILLELKLIADVGLVGFPNVGKSTLFNKLTGKRISIVEDTPGVTRDRIYHETEWRGRRLMLVDTGGIEPKTDSQILRSMRRQAEIAVETADVIIFLTDLRSVLPTTIAAFPLFS